MAPPSQQRPPAIAVRGLTAPEPASGPAILRDVDFAVQPGERVVLSGPSGSGKSTLLRCMVLLQPAAGAVLLDGEPVAPARVRELRRRVGYVAQRPVSVGGTVYENLSFPRQLHVDAMTETAQRALLARLGMGEIPGDRRFEELSGGEQQRVALVRSLSARPEVLLLDEPTASLDPENVGAVVEALERWLEEEPSRALVWVSHHAHQVEGLATRRVPMRELSR